MTPSPSRQPEGLRKILKTLNQLEEVIGLTVARAFIHAAVHPNVTITEMADALNLSPSNLSMHLNVLKEGKYAMKGQVFEGLGLLEEYKRVEDKRPTYLRLTPKGKRFLDTLE